MPMDYCCFYRSIITYLFRIDRVGELYVFPIFFYNPYIRFIGKMEKSIRIICTKLPHIHIYLKVNKNISKSIPLI